MISGGCEWRRDIFKKPFIAVIDHAGLAVHRFRGPNGSAAERLIYALHAQTNPEDRDIFVKFLDQLDGDPRMGRVPGAGADKDIIGFQ